MFIETNIPDLLIYKPKVFKDHRGLFFESYNASHFESRNLNAQFVQDNRSTSRRGTLRGLHFQTGAHAQAKLVSVTKGHVYDIAVDLRPASTTFGQWFGIELHEENPCSLYIPKGFAHGFIVLSESADFFYKVDNYYNKDSEAGIIFNDPDLKIDWRLNPTEFILSDKDIILPTFAEFKKGIK